ncbi:MAG: LysM peptidoglycan-binding domain-containing protein [Candidatus Omnitrophica bacterium]|nr:LysM peptidoglycan-binding domain-containing protein [Candidatus Omnitrophota bacterium]
MNRRFLVITAAIIVAGLIFLVFLAKKHNKAFKAIKSVNVTAPVFSSSRSLLGRAKELEAKGNLWEAKLIYQKLIVSFASSSEVMSWQRKAEELNMRLLFSPVVTPKSVAYEIRHGDTLTRIAKEFKTTAELIMRSNHLVNDRLVPGVKIKVWAAPFSMLVDKSQNTLILKSEEEVMKTYIVSTGSHLV